MTGEKKIKIERNHANNQLNICTHVMTKGRRIKLYLELKSTGKWEVITWFRIHKPCLLAFPIIKGYCFLWS